MAYDVTHPEWSWSWAIDTASNTVGLIPTARGVIKTVRAAGKALSHTDEAVKGAKTIAGVAKQVGAHADDASKAASKFSNAAGDAANQEVKAVSHLDDVKNPKGVSRNPEAPSNLGPEHHIATNKNEISTLRGGPWTPRFRKIFEKAGMTLEDAANKIRIPGHAGPHPEAYHQAVYDRLISATAGLKGDAYKDALIAELRAIANEAVKPGTFLNRLLTQ